MSSNSTKIIPKLEYLIEVIAKLILNLQELKTAVQNHKADCDIAKGVATGLNTVGTAAAIASLFIPGGFLVAGGIALATTLGGTATNVATTVIDTNKTNEVIDKIKNIIKRFEGAKNDFDKLAEKLAHDVLEFRERSHASLETSMELLIANNYNNGNVDLNKLTVQEELLNMKQRVTYVKLGAYLVALCPKLAFGIGTVISVIPQLSIIGQSLINISTAAKEAAQAGASAGSRAGSKVVATSASKALIGAGVVFQTFELVTTIVELVENHPTIQKIDDALEGLISIKKEYEHILSEMHSACNEGKTLLKLSCKH
jgi:hypothetical protein